jgi:hypothetical protein
MSLTYSIDPAAGVVELRYFGRQDFAEWSAVMYAILEDPAFAEGYGFLSDRRLVSEVPTTDFVQATLTFLRTHQARLGARRWAAIVNDAASYGMGRMAQQLGEALPFPNRDLHRCGTGTPLGEGGRRARTDLLCLTSPSLRDASLLVPFNSNAQYAAFREPPPAGY